MIKTTLKLCALILGAALFIPFSCTGSLVGGMFLFIELDARDLTKGEKPYSTFYILALPSGEDQSLEYVTLNRIDPSFNKGYCEIAPIDREKYSFLLPQPESKLGEREWEEDGYKVTELSPGRQRIEVYTNTEDYRFTSIYLVEDDRVKPLRSKVFGPGQAFQAVPYALLFVLVLYGLGKWLRHKCYPDKIPVSVRYTLTLSLLGALVPLFLWLQIPIQFSDASATDAAASSVGSTGMNTFWVCAYLFLALGSWVTAFLRVRENPFALKATALTSTLLIIFIPFGTINFVYWLLRIRKKDGKSPRIRQNFQEQGQT